MVGKSKFEKWKRWLEAIHCQIRQLLADEKIFLKVYRMRQNNLKLSRLNAFGFFDLREETWTANPENFSPILLPKR